MRRTIFCNHYRAAADHKTCEAGVEYAKLAAHGTAISNWPCFRRLPAEAPPGCDLAAFPTPEELAEQDRQDAARFEGVSKARSAIVQHLGGSWKRGAQGSQGVIDCPVCNQPQSLKFSRSGYNGHVHAACATAGCVAWME